MASLERESLPKRLGDFEIVREVGRGGMGVVYEARQISLNRRVALKVLAAGLGLTGRAIERFQREAEAAAKLHHTNIIPVYATGQQDGVYFYVMELIEGPSLDRVLLSLRQTPHGGVPAAATEDDTAVPGWVGDTMAYAQGLRATAAPSASSSGALRSGHAYYDTVARMIADVADALEHAHQHGVIHRDIKPSNLLLAADGKLSLNDFGLARVLEQPGMTQTGEFVGTPAYMSPEQIAAGRVLLDHRTDIYSLGATLYEMLALQPPFKAERRDQILTQILHKEPTPPRALQKQVPVDLETICLKALDKDPDRRYQHARHLAEDLRRYRNRFAIHARRAGVVDKGLKWMRRHPGLAAALACLLVALGGAGYFAYRFVDAERAGAAERRKLVADQQQKDLHAALRQTSELALRGKFADAERALDKAGQLGAPEGEIAQQRGLIALLRGQSGDAVEQLEIAVQRLPNRFTPLVMLNRAHHDAGHFDLFYSQRWAPLAEMKPEAAEDYLFLGQTIAKISPPRGLTFMDRAIELGDYAMPRVMRAEVRTLLAQMTGQASDAEQALADVKVARSLLGDDPLVVQASLDANLTAACAYERAQQPEQRRAVLAAAAHDVEQLQAWPGAPRALRLCMVYFDHIDDHAALQAAYRAERERNGGAIAGRYYFNMLFRAGKFVEALEVLERMPRAGNEVMYHMRRGLVVAHLADGVKQARLVYDRGLAQATDSSKSFVNGREGYIRNILQLLGRREDVTEIYRTMVAEGKHISGNAMRWYETLSGDPQRWAEKSAEYRAGLLTDEQFLALSGPSLLSQCESQYVIAMVRLSGGDRAGARRHFEACVATRVLGFIEHEWSRNFLAQMDRDPAWPRWIQAMQ